MEELMHKKMKSPMSASEGRRRLLGAAGMLSVVATGLRLGVSWSQSSRSFYADGLSNLMERRKINPSVDEEVSAILRRVITLKKTSLLTRGTSLAQLANPGRLRLGSVDSRAYEIQKSDPAKATQFALAMADTSSTQMLFDELPFLAAAYVLTTDAAVLAKISAQLEEVLTWRPLQRPGWSLYGSKASLPMDGDDGAWLATGLGIAALTATLKILPAGSIDGSLRAEVIRQVAFEATRITDDWNQSVQWFVRDRKPASNQWIVVASAAVLASSVIEGASALSVRNFGVDKLLETLSVLGDEGALSEGFVYGLNWDAPFLYLAARAASEMGDDRLQSHPFLKCFPRWLVQQFQPAHSLVNCFDTYTGARLCYPLMSGNISLVAALSEDSEIIWIRNNIFSKEFQANDLFGLLALGKNASYAREPEAWGSYKRGALVTWRSGWDQGASGVWLRGGHFLDSHDHNDHGHINYIVNGKIVLMEAGTPAYSDPEIGAMFKSVVGHNVLQVGDELEPKKMPAPIYIEYLDREGGSADIDAGAGYAGVKSWRRSVKWNSSELKVVDSVSLVDAQSIIFRWHLGSEERLVISNERQISVTLPAGNITFPGWIGDIPDNLNWNPDARDVLSTPSIKIEINANQPIFADEERSRDHTLKFRIWNRQHTVLIVRTRTPVSDVIIKTLITAG
jgi:hypothetical protein